MDQIVVLKIVDNTGVELNGVKLHSTDEVAQALGKVHADHPGAIISIEADESRHYESIGKALYGSARAGFSGDRLRILVEGKLV